MEINLLVKVVKSQNTYQASWVGLLFNSCRDCFMDSVDIFPWDDNFCTGLPEVDEQHKKLVLLLNELASHVAFQSGAAALDKIFDELADYATYHFACEEAIWAHHLPGDRAEADHVASHQAFVGEVARLRAKMNSSTSANVAEEVLGFLAQWLASHILESDRYLAYVVEAIGQGLTLVEAKAKARERMGGATRVLIDIILSIYSMLSSNTLRLMRELAEHRKIEHSLRQTQEELEESRRLLQAIVDAVPVRLFWKDRDLNYLGCNPVFARDAGMQDASEIIGKNDYAMNWAPQAELYRADDQRVIETGVPKLDYEEPQTTPDGRVIWLRSSKVPLQDRSGAIVGVLGVYEDITAEKNSVEAIRKSEAKFHSLYSSMTEGVALHELVFDANGQPGDYRLLDVNPAFEVILGLTKADVVGRLASEVYGAVPYLEEYARVAHGGEPFSFQADYTPMGRIFSVSVFSPAANQFASVFQDITELRRAEDVRRESEERLRLAMTAANQAWFDVDLASGTVHISPNYPEMIGFSSGEFESSLVNWLANVHPDDLANVQEKYRRCIEDGGPEIVEYRRRTKSGDWLWIETTGKVVKRDENGKPLRVLGIHADVSQRHQALHEQFRLNRALRLLSKCNLVLARSSSEESLLSDICQLIVDLGGYELAWVGYPEETPEKPVRLVAQAGGRREYLEKLHVSWDPGSAFGNGPSGKAINAGKSVVVQGGPQSTSMAPWQAMLAEHGYQSVISLPMHQEDKVLGVLSVYSREQNAFSGEEVLLLEELANNLAFGIVSLRNRFERQAAEAANRAKSSFIANISHEIRTPLNAITGMVHMLRRSTPSPHQQECLDKIDAAGEHLLELINNVLDLSKIEADKIELEERPVSVKALIENVLTMVQPKAQAKNLALVCRAIPELPALRGDSVRLQQALLNYLSNAIKFTETGQVLLGCEVLDRSASSVLLRFTVEDTGMGIAPEALGRMFSTFEQADNSTTRKFGGTGLGLAITRKIAQLMGGDVGVQSQVGCGSRFWFTARLGCEVELPVEEVRLPLEQICQELGKYAGRHVLLVEDDEINQEVALMLLEDFALRVDVAGNGRLGLEKAKKENYDLILMDMQMPEMDGLEATRQIRQLPAYRTTPIVAMTANAFSEDRQRCMDAGMTHFVSKPIMPERLFETILWAFQGEHIG